MIGKFFHQNLERSLSHVELVTLLFQLLNFRDNLTAVIAIGVEHDTEFPGLIFDIAFAGHIRNQNPSFIADQGRIHVLVSLGGFHNGTHVDAAFVGKGTLAHKRSIFYGYLIRCFTDIARKGFEFFKIVAGNTGPFHFQIQDRNNRSQIRIAAPLSIAVDRALNHDGTRMHGGYRVGHRQSAVIVGMNAQLDGDTG